MIRKLAASIMVLLFGLLALPIIVIYGMLVLAVIVLGLIVGTIQGIWEGFLAKPPQKRKTASDKTVVHKLKW
jgi:hypothetical protein